MNNLNPSMKNIFLQVITFFCFMQMPGLQPPINLNHLDNYYQQVVKDWEIPGMTVGIVKDGQLIFSKGYGVKEEGKTEKPDANSLYAIASNSKAFTTAMIAMLVQEGKLSWTDKVVDILPYFELYDPYISQLVTIEDLLCHRVGLGTFSGDFIWYKSDLTAEEIIKRFKHLPPAYEFRDGYGYSNLMYVTAGEVISKVTGKSWAENVKERILIPLDMNRTIASVNDLEKAGNYASPHTLKDGKNVPIEWANWDIVAATGGIISSINDVAKWMIWNLNHGIVGQDTMLSAQSRNRIWTPHNTFTVDHTSKNDFDRHFSGYGLGWGLSDYHGRLRAGHTGGYDGFITAVNLIPDENLGVVVLTNGMKSPIMAVTYYTIDHFLGVKGKDWSKDMLESRNKNMAGDTRISGRKEKRVLNTKPSLKVNDLTGTYTADIYGDIIISEKDGALRMDFEHSPELSATLEHWHYDVWKLNWDKEHAWFSFGTVQFNMDNNMEVKRLTFDVPNDDIFFEELNPIKIK
jgi:CubicO group peptidase (beta-lactamase class C family)